MKSSVCSCAPLSMIVIGLSAVRVITDEVVHPSSGTDVIT